MYINKLKTRAHQLVKRLDWGMDILRTGIRLPTQSIDLQNIQTSPEDQPAYPMGTRGGGVELFLRDNWASDNAHSPLSSAEMNNAWGYTLTPPWAFMSSCLKKNKGKCTFSITYCPEARAIICSSERYRAHLAHGLYSQWQSYDSQFPIGSQCVTSRQYWAFWPGCK